MISPLINRIYLLLIFYFFTLNTPRLLAENTPYHFGQISLKEGLKQACVRNVVEDSKGTYWIATPTGVERLIGKEIIRYGAREGELQKEILFLAEDARGFLWAGTSDALFRFDEESGEFLLIRHEGENIRAHSCLVLPQEILFGSTGHIYRFGYEEGYFEVMEIEKEGMGNINEMVLLDENKLLILNSWHGVLCLDLTTHHSEWLIAEEQETRYCCIFVDSAQQIWLSLYNKGVRCYDTHGKLLREYRAANSFLSHDVVWDIDEFDGALWFATDGGGITLHVPETGKSTYLNHTPGDNNSFPVNSVNSLYKDRKGMVWASTVRGGLISIHPVLAQSYRAVAIHNSHGLTHETILSLYNENDSTLWIGTDGGGVNRFNPQSNRFYHYAESFGEKVTDITAFDSDNLLLSIFSKGLFLFNKRSGILSPFTLEDERVAERLKSRSVAIHFLRCNDGNIYLLSGESYLLEVAKRRVLPLQGMGNALSELPCKPLYTFPERSLVYDQSAIYEIEHTTGVVKKMYDSDSNQLQAACWHNDTLWMVEENALFRLDYLTGKRVHVPVPFEHYLRTLICDSKGHLWIGTNQSVICMNIATGDFRLLDETDGMEINEFISDSNGIEAFGNIYLGGVAGLVRISNTLSTRVADSASVELFSIIRNQQPVSVSEFHANGRTLEVPYNYNLLKLRTVVRETTPGKSRLLRFHIQGIRTSVIETPHTDLELPMLSPGVYKIAVTYNSKNGSWSDPQSLLTLKVRLPWWRQTWFILLVFGGIIGIAFFIFHFYSQHRKTRFDLQMKEHESLLAQEKVDFLINISHELRTPLTLIHAPLKQLLSDEELPGRLRTSVLRVCQQSEWMNRLINMVLDIRKLENGQSRLRIEEVELSEWITTLTERFRNEYEYKGVNLSCCLDEAPQTIAFDREKFDIVLSNLLMNALKYSESGTRVTVTAEPAEREGYIRLAVQDEGIGIDPEEIESLFTLYYQSQNSRSGFGIGLAYSRMLVEMHPRATINAHRNREQGSTFFVEIPDNLVFDQQREITPDAITQLFTTSDQEMIKPDLAAMEIGLENYSVLIVEDEQELNEFLTTSLRPSFRAVYSASDGMRGVELIERYHPDIVISDVMMPHMNGFELCRHIKSNLQVSHIPVILLTARNDAESAALGYKMGADIYVPKPFEISFLRDIIRNQLYSRELIKRRYQNLHSPLSPVEATFSNADESFLLKLDEVIFINLDNKDLDVRLLATSMGMCRTSFCTKMKQLTNIGAMEYVRQRRIRRASELLRSTEMSLLEVALEVGFDDARYFGKVFKQMMGVSPLNYRKGVEGEVTPPVSHPHRAEGDQMPLALHESLL